jgi:hypothetical protein
VTSDALEDEAPVAPVTLASRIRRSWAARPRIELPAIDWRRTGIKALRIGVLASVVAVVLGVGAFATATIYADYGAVKNGPNARAWAALTPRFAGAATCTACHGRQAAAQDASIHVDVSCEDCHGPAADHAASDIAARSVVLAKPPSSICARCHTATTGRPAAFPQVDLATHYVGGPCLRCHDPHSVVAQRPPIVTHPLTDLPECTTCHAPDGLKKIPSGHQVVGDKVCLSCHGTNANPDRDRP